MNRLFWSTRESALFLSATFPWEGMLISWQVFDSGIKKKKKGKRRETYQVIWLVIKRERKISTGRHMQVLPSERMSCKIEQFLCPILVEFKLVLDLVKIWMKADKERKIYFPYGYIVLFDFNRCCKYILGDRLWLCLKSGLQEIALRL